MGKEKTVMMSTGRGVAGLHPQPSNKRMQPTSGLSQVARLNFTLGGITMKSYTPEKPPRRGNALRIWRELSAIPGLEMIELHYNPNCFGNAKHDGWGTWACHFRFEGTYYEQWCGWDNDNGAYLMGNIAPFRVVFAKTMIPSNNAMQPTT